MFIGNNEVIMSDSVQELTPQAIVSIVRDTCGGDFSLAAAQLQLPEEQVQQLYRDGTGGCTTCGNK